LGLVSTEETGFQRHSMTAGPEFLIWLKADR